MPAQLLPGFDSLQDVINNRLTSDEIIRVVDEAIAKTLATHNDQTSKMLNLFCTPTSEYKVRYRTPYAAYLQPHDGEFARMQPIKGAGSYDIAFPLASAGIGFGWTRLQRIKSTVQDVNDKLTIMLDADLRYLRYNILASLYQNTDYVYEDQEHGSLVVKPIANGDTQEYLTLPGAELPTIANHFDAQAGAVADATNPFPAIYDKLTIRPENGDGRVISFIPTTMRTAVESLATFIEDSDPDIREGANTRILVGSFDSPVPGKVIGKVGRSWIAEWKALPDNYVISVHTGGDRPLAMREHPESELRGFRAVAERADHPYTERHFERHVGFGVRNRLSAHIQRVGNAAYAIPTGFDRVSVM